MKARWFRGSIRIKSIPQGPPGWSTGGVPPDTMPPPGQPGLFARPLPPGGRDLAYGRLSKINILADKPIPAERSEGPSEQSGLAAGGIAPGGMPPVDHPGGPWEIDFILIEPRNNLAFILFRSG